MTAVLASRRAARKNVDHHPDLTTLYTSCKRILLYSHRHVYASMSAHAHEEQKLILKTFPTECVTYAATTLFYIIDVLTCRIIAPVMPPLRSSIHLFAQQQGTQQWSSSEVATFGTYENMNTVPHKEHPIQPR